MHAEDVQRVIRTQHFLQTIDTPEAGETCNETDDQTAADADVARCRCDGHQAGDRTRGCAQHRSLAAHQRFTDAPGQHSRSRGTQGIDEGQGSETVGFECRAGVETEPAHPQQGGADHGQCQAVWGHGFFAVTNALAQHVSTDQTGHSGVDVHDGAAGKVQRARLPDVAGFGVHGIHHFFACVSVRAHPEPDHVSDRCVAEGEPDHHEHQYGGELHALRKSADDQCASDTCKRGLEGGKDDLRNDHALAESGGIGESARRVVPDTGHHQAVKAAKEGIALGEGQAVTVDEPQHHDHRERDHDLHQHGQHVFAAHQAAVEKSQAGNGHEDDQNGGNHHPAGVTLVGYQNWRGRRGRCSSRGRCGRGGSGSGRRSSVSRFGFGGCSNSRGGSRGLRHDGAGSQQTQPEGEASK